MDAGTAHIAALAGGLGAVLVLAGRGRVLVLGGIGLLGGGELGLALSTSDANGLDALLSPAGAVAALVGLGALAAAASFFVRRPALVPIVVLAAAPFRLPLSFDSSHTLLVTVADDGQLGRLLPLYFVLAAAVLALVWRIVKGEDPARVPTTVAAPAAAFFAYACASLLWSDDLDAGVNLLSFFTLPFAALLAVVARSPFPGWAPRALARTGIALAVLFASIGLLQAATRELFFFAPNLELSNANSSYFRVTSLFVDPSLYGRHVVLGMAIVLVALALKRLGTGPALGLLALLFGGLFFSYSQSSMTALVAVLLAIAAATGNRGTRRAVALVLVLFAAGAGAFLISVAARDDSLRQETSDRSRRVEDTVRVVADHPVVGVGIGGQPRASRRLSDSDAPTPNFVSHTTPLTVAAELGAIGVLLYLALLAGGARAIDRVRRSDQALGLALGAAFLALFVHALSYSGFLEDPITWVVLGVTSAALTAHTASRSPSPA